MTNKLLAILYGIILVFATIARFFDCLFVAMLKSWCVNMGYFIEAFKYEWNDSRKYVSFAEHKIRIEELWGE